MRDEKRWVREVTAASAVLLLTLAGCTQNDEVPPPSGPSSPPRPFTVMTTDRIATADPAAVTDQGSMMLVTNAFQRLITAGPGESEVAPGIWAFKPDLARDCSFPSGPPSCAPSTTT